MGADASEGIEEFIKKVIKLLEGKTTKTKIRLDGIQLKAGDSRIKVDGEVDLTFTPVTRKKK